MSQTQTAPKFNENCQMVDFDNVKIHMMEKGYWVATVSGTKPYANMRIDLIPNMYARQPEYWGITVRGCFADDIAIPTEAPYEINFPLAGCKGIRGIQVIGATKAEKIDIECK